MGSFLRLAALQGILLLVVMLLVEVASYFLLPNSLAWGFHDYRRHQNMVAENIGHAVGYYRPHETRGHDIAPDGTGVLSFGEARFPIWSNSLGCFDSEWDSVPAGYYYFAGDSYTWGYNRFEDNFPTLFESETGIASLKCGVSSTGTRHQFEKFREIAEVVGHFPRRVIVSYFANDIADDFVHPHKTVIDGFLIEHTFLDKALNPVRADSAWLHEKLAEHLQSERQELGCDFDVKEWIKCHSLIANLYIALKNRFVGGTDADGPMILHFEHEGQQLAHVLTIEALHATPECHDCNDDRNLGEANFRAFADWKAHSEANGYELAIMFIPPRYAHGHRGHYAGRSRKLAGLGIDVLDLAEEFHAAGASVTDLYWRYDGHFSPGGSRLAADALIRRWGR